MSALRQQMIDAALVRGFSPRTHKSYQAAISTTIVIEGLSATEWVRFFAPAIEVCRRCDAEILTTWNPG